jgi:transposase-like protein
MAEEVLIPELTEKIMYCPECKTETVHVYEGPVRFYSSWRCKVCGKSILGEPLHPFPLPPF